jgi:PAS domain S-box-containing protein
LGGKRVIALNEKAARRPEYGFLLVFIVLAAGIVASGFFFYGNYKKHFRAEIERQLSAIAELKVSELAEWRAENLADAAIFFKNASFSGLVRQFLEKPKESAGRDQLRIWLIRFQAAHEYDRILLLDVHGVERIAVPDTSEPVAAHLLEQAPAILRSDRVTFVDFHRDAPDGPIYISVLVPVLDDGEDTRAMGILVLMIDPEKYLYPYISRWPTPSRTAETLIVRRDGNDALFLNELRFQKNTALNLRSPLGNKDMPAVQAALGQEGFMEGKDYRGVPVLAALRAVRDSPWFLVARMDIAEAFAPLRERVGVMIALIGSLLLGAGGGTGFVWRHQRAHFYRERYEAAEALRAVSLRKEALLSAVPDIIIEVDSNKVYTWANLAGFEFFGEDVIGKEAAFYFEGEQDTYQIVKPMFDGHEAEIYVESWQRRKDGEKRLLAWWCRVLKDDNGRVTGALSSARDITERKRAEEALVIQKRIGDIFLTIPGDEMYYEVLKIILEAMESPFGVFGYIDEDGASVVPSMTRVVWDKCQVPQKTITFPRETWGDSSWPRAIREKKPNYSNEISTKTPEGHVSIKRHISLPILYQGEAIGLFQVANKEVDYTEADIRALETIAGYVASILSARLQLRRHEEELQKKNDELIRFTYTVSHDLKSPLVTIRTFLGYLEQDIRKPDAAIVDKDLTYIRNAADKVSRLLDELLELSRIGRKVNPPVEVPLQEVVKEALDLAAGQIAERGVTVKVTKDPIQLFGDRPRLVEVFQNLVDNAVKFMGRQRAPCVEIGVDKVGGETVLFVRDNGIGIDPQYQPKLFGLFEKLDPGTEGTGIGLALVKRIVEVHGGRIWVESEGPGKGATFRFTVSGKEKTRSRGDTEKDEGS